MNPFDILLVVAGVGYLMVRRLRGDLLEIKGLVVVPAILTVIGISSLHDHPVDVTSVAFLAVGIGLSVGIGLLRGATVHLAERDGVLWMRYRANTVGLWVLSFAVKFALIPVELVVSKSATTTADRGLLLSIGLGIFAESAVVVLRAMRTRAAVVWAKGDDGEPHTMSPAFDRARDYVHGGPRPRNRDW